MNSLSPQASPASSSSLATPSSSRPSLSAPSLHARSRSSSPSSSDRLFTPFKEMISGGEGSRSLGVASAGLGALRDVLEAVDTLPFVKYLASVGVQLLQYVIEMQITNDMFKNLAFRAKDVIVAVARSCDGLQSLAYQLESDLRQLTGTMDSILAFAAEKASRGTLRKLWNKSEDVAMVKALDIQLTHSFNIFQIQSDVVVRRQQELMISQLANLTASPPLPTRTDPSRDADCPYCVTEGIYLIQNVASKNVLEIEDFKPFGHVLAVHAFMVPYTNSPPQMQLWLIQKNANKDLEYTIHNLATGYVLNVVFNSDREGAKVGGYPWEPGHGNGTWSFWGAGSGESSDYCTIRSIGLPTVLDGVCPRTNKSQCNDLHATRIADAGSGASQQWQLIPVTPSPNPTAPVLTTSKTASAFPRRQLLLQNVQTGLFATRTETLEGPNITLASESSPTNSTWSFLYIDTIRRDRFAILSCSSRPFTVDHWGGQYINLARYRPENPYHKWIAIPRDGAFLLRNNITDVLLAARSGVVDTLPLSARDNTACHWRLVDATTKEHVRILYDSALSIVPRELAGPRTPTTQRLPLTTSPTLRTGDASPELGHVLLDNFKREHATIITMLQDGYQTIVYAPRSVSGWKRGEVRTVRIEDDDSEFKWSWKKFEPCS